MSFIADNEVPIRRCSQLGLQLVRPCGHIEPHDQPTLFHERIAGDRGFDLVSGQQIEAEVEFFGHFFLPLFDKASRRDDQAPIEIPADHQLLNEEAGHDRLAGTRIVGEQKPKRLARQHLAINSRDLMRQSLDLRGADRKVGIEEMSETDTIGFGS
ncbi:hypothetical protein BJA5080_06102 [Bradyrhizobium diazoefficiens SEMIA 5080]|uniref:Uncharacterized protein n=1 Tax=Bradyrhizobium diazoefficiens SEMIA 5080 TaxID=754504 RepID=A0A837C588_9BRAD|nr:hypothetical protein BJA5080_06102 [Bradyrhizobium diazoefficiens SEMIA 5080]